MIQDRSHIIVAAAVALAVSLLALAAIFVGMTRAHAEEVDGAPVVIFPRFDLESGGYIMPVELPRANEDLVNPPRPDQPATDEILNGPDPEPGTLPEPTAPNITPPGRTWEIQVVFLVDGHIKDALTYAPDGKTAATFTSLESCMAAAKGDKELHAATDKAMTAMTKRYGPGSAIAIACALRLELPLH